jgi:hypothetical protein
LIFPRAALDQVLSASGRLTPLAASMPQVHESCSP